MHLKSFNRLILSALLGFGFGTAQAQHDSNTGITASTQRVMLATHAQNHNDSTTSRPLRKGTRPFGAQPDDRLIGSNVS